MDAYKTINDVLVHLFNEILNLEENAIITDEFKNISVNDMHIIEAIGLGDNSTMSVVAKKLGITPGSLTTSVNSLVNKKYVVRSRSEADRRIVYISLTDTGRSAYEKHREFHDDMTSAAIEYLTEEEVQLMLKMLDRLTVFFHKYKDNV